MSIHTTLANEKIGDISNKYGICEEYLRMINDIPYGEPTEGDELLILTPTRSYTVQYSDTVDRIAMRFGTRKKDIYLLNPWLNNTPLKEGMTIAVRYGERRRGMAVANGYLFSGCTEEALKRALPYLTYVTFAGAIADNHGVRRCANFRKEIALAREEKKIPLLRVYDKYTERYKDGDLSNYAESLIELARADGYKGIVLNSCPLSDYADNFTAFLMILRKMMIGCDLILITEINSNSPSQFSEYADGSVMYMPKFASESPMPFIDSERKIVADFACQGESAKVFIDLPSIARCGGKYTSILDVLDYARRKGCAINRNESTLLSHVCDKKQGEFVFSSLKYIEELLDLVCEFDYMGVCFDIMRTPLSHLMLYNSMFKTSYFNDVRTREGCSRADGA